MADVLTGADDTATGCIKGLNMRNFNPCFGHLPWASSHCASVWRASGASQKGDAW